MSISRKKVIVRNIDGTLQHGYLPLTGILSDQHVSLLDLQARILPLPLQTIRWIAFVRDFNLSDSNDPERLTRRAFLARPRTEGLWLRITFHKGDLLEGLTPLDRSLLDALVTDRGLFLIPPDIRSNTQRLYIPHTSIETLQLLAVITKPSKSKPKPSPTENTAQPSLFPTHPPSTSS